MLFHFLVHSSFTHAYYIHYCISNKLSCYEIWRSIVNNLHFFSFQLKDNFNNEVSYNYCKQIETNYFWIFMLFLVKRVLIEYKSLVVNKWWFIGMQNSHVEYSFDVKIVMGLTIIMPILKVVHKLMNFVWTFLCVTLWDLQRRIMHNCTPYILIQIRISMKRIWTPSRI